MSRVRPTGSRVFLRVPVATDMPEFTELVNRSRRMHAGWVAPPCDPEQFARYIARARSDDFEAMLVIRADDARILGAINLSQIFRGPFQNAYLGFWVGTPFAGQGYMREGLTRGLTHAFRTLRLHRVEANVQPSNAASRRLVQRLGFRLEGYSPRYLKIAGRWRDHERWALLREEWPRSRRTAAGTCDRSWETR